jgi:rhodanese-related sulfurtransferase
MKEITPIELHALLQKQQVSLFDVREPHEHEAFHLGGQLIPLDEVISNAQQIPKDQLVVIYCKKGIRSQLAIQRLEQKFGHTNLVNLTGGVEAWRKQFANQ